MSVPFFELQPPQALEKLTFQPIARIRGLRGVFAVGWGRNFSSKSISTPA
jgi:hypothetical protein